MIVVLRVLEILAIFSLLGLPFNLFFLPRITGSYPVPHVSPRLLLAPAAGLAVFAVYTAAFFATKHPVAIAITFFWPLLASLWLAVAVDLWQSDSFSGRRCFVFNVKWPRIVAQSLVVLGLLIALAGYLWPFVRQPDLVFWHYAGSDGYFYMRIAEHVANPGTGVISTIGPYDAASGFLAEELSLFHAGAFVDKPGTMSTLGGMAGLLGLITHETFSPLVVASLAMLYLVLIALGQSLLRLPVWASLAFACLGTLALPVWMLATHTFLGNVLALPFYPTIMLMVRPSATWRTAVYVGLLLAAQMVVFPDGSLALVGMLALTILCHCWTALRRGRLRRFLAAGLIALGTASVLVSPFGQVIYATAFLRLQQVLFTRPPPSLFISSPSLLQEAGPAAIKPLIKIDWIWGALNLNTIPPQPLKAGEFPYLLGLAGGVGLFVLVSIWRRQPTRLLPYLISFLLLIALGLAGLFQSDYELFRALAIFAFVPLAALCVLPWLAAGHSNNRSAMVLRFVIIAMLGPLLVHFIRNDWSHFRLGYEEHMADCQYTTGNLRDRIEITRLGQSNSLILTSENASFTAFANVLMLFSQVKLGAPGCYNKFIYFKDIALNEAPYGAALVVRNLRYADITETMPDKLKLYASSDFEVVENDLEPFFDNDTLPIVNAFPAEFLKKHQLTLTRTLSQRTEIKFFSRVNRSVVIELQFAPGDLPSDLPCAFDNAPPQNAVVDHVGRVTLPSMTIERGPHKIVLGPLARPTEVRAFRIRENGTGLTLTAKPFVYDGF